VASGARADYASQEAVVSAVDCCIEQNILVDFFREHRKEVSNMILNELTNTDAIEAVVGKKPGKR
jgi:hypothetical protein